MSRAESVLERLQRAIRAFPQLADPLNELMDFAEQGMNGEIVIQFHDGVPQRSHRTTTTTYRKRPNLRARAANGND